MKFSLKMYIILTIEFQSWLFESTTIKKQTGEHCQIHTKPERNPMRKLALPDEILLKIEKPARYIGGEVNSVTKDPDKVDIRFAMCFPDV